MVAAGPSPALATFPLARLRLCGVVEAPVAFRGFAGATLRGAFGLALRSQVCVTGLEDCRTCPLYRSCVYPKIFDPPPLAGLTSQRIPVPYVIQPPRPDGFVWAQGEPFEIGFVVIGGALAHIPVLIHAWRKALVSVGKSGRLRLTHVLDEQGRRIFDAEVGRMEPVGQTLAIPDPPEKLSDLTLDFLTPLSFMRDGRDLPPAAWTPSDLLMALARRAAALYQASAGQRLAIDFAALKQAAADVQGQANWQQQHWSRHSGRQHRRIPLQGAVGQWRLSGSLLPFWPWLYLGQWLHAGKKASHGLGRYRLSLPVAGPSGG